MTAPDISAIYQQVLWASLGLSLMLGWVAQRSHFCTMGALGDIANMGDWSRMRMWVTAMAVAIFGFGLMSWWGWVDTAKSLYGGSRWLWLSALTGGLLFGFGLILSGMTDPGKVIGFLDLFGQWDPSLAFVMGGAIAVGFFAFSMAKRRTQNFLGGAMRLPTSQDIDKRLVIGSLVFGAGWGLAGFCPGPALVSLGAGQDKAVVFVIAMVLGMLAFEWLEGRRMKAAAA